MPAWWSTVFAVPSRFCGCIGLAFSSPSQGSWRLVLWTPQWHSCQRFSGRRRYSRISWLPSGLPEFSVLLYNMSSRGFPPRHIASPRATSLVGKDGLWWHSWEWWPGQWPACFGLAAGRKLCAPGGGRAAGSALRKIGGLEWLPFLWRQK